MTSRSKRERSALEDAVRERDHSFREGYRHALRELQSVLKEMMAPLPKAGKTLMKRIYDWAQARIERTL